MTLISLPSHPILAALVLSTIIFSLPTAAAGDGDAGEGEEITASLAALPREKDSAPADPSRTDWLIDGSPCKARLCRTGRDHEIVLSNGLIRRVFRLAPNGATVAFDNLMTDEAILRGVKPEASVTLDGVEYAVGGLTGQPNYAFLRPEWIDALRADPAAMKLVGFEEGTPKERMPWKRVRHHAPGAAWPPHGVSLRMDYRIPLPAAHEEEAATNRKATGKHNVTVSVHYELYDGLPLLSKWITVTNGGNDTVTINGFKSEILAAVEYGSAVEDRGVLFSPPNLHVETDYAFSGMTAANANRCGLRWVTDPDYKTQVNYQRRNPCLLEVGPEQGPARTVPPGGSFESFRAFLLVRDGTDRERNGLAQRRVYRTVAPWVTENPLMMHVRYADWKTVKNAIDQCASVGFEMVILTFGSGFNIEKDSAEYIAEMKKYADYARSMGIEIGGYSLLASRSVGGGHDVVMPAGQRPTFGNSPCLGSEWGRNYFDKLHAFYEKTGFALLEHDGSYPGDVCTAEHHPGHRGLADSRWNQWSKIAAFYHWCRGRGIYLNVPDYYYLAGSNKCGMGYRETNWSLPRAQQVIHTRQNIYDGTWQKTPSMGWMFVPLTQYHGGGAAATIEPLDHHLPHYERMLCCNLALGVQACYRGPRLYDSSRTRLAVKKWVDWFRKYRPILESDMIHGRRADGRDIDWMLHVNPALGTKGMLVVFNPLKETVEKTLRVNLYYTGLTDAARIREKEGEPLERRLDGSCTIDVPVKVAGESMTWFVVEEA
jgi:hypothetical protein